jgi:hypothetical protein
LNSIATNSAVAIGDTAKADTGADNSVVIGGSANSTNQFGTVIGFGSTNHVVNGISIGDSATTSTNDSGIAIGTGTVCSGDGSSASAAGVVIGFAASTAADGGIAIGSSATVAAGHTNSIAFGNNTTTTQAGQLVLPSNFRSATNGAATNGSIVVRINGVNYRIQLYTFP